MMLAAIAAAVALLASSPVQGSVFGPVVSVGGDTFTITTTLSPSGKSKVSAGSARITEEVVAPRSSLKVDACVMASGAKNSKGVVAATRVTLSAPVKGSCAAPGGFRTRAGGGPPPGGGQAPRSGFKRPANLGFAIGMVKTASASTLTVKGRTGTTTVTVSSKTSIVRTATVKVSAITTKLCAFVNGTSADKGKTVKATNIALSQKRNGTCAGGSRVAGR
jgi:hypothetical protein